MCEIWRWIACVGLTVSAASTTPACGDAEDGDADASTMDARVAMDSGLDARVTSDAAMDSSIADAMEEPLDANTDAATRCDAVTATHVYLIGDSTTASGSGWGDFFADYLTSDAPVTNAAASGRSSKSFYDEGRFDPVRGALTAGDFVLIQFGHNDEKPDVERHTEPGTAPDYEGSFRDHLERYIDEVRAAGATPILLTPVSRMVFSSGGSLNRTHGEYPAAVRAVAADAGVVLLDLEQESFDVFDGLGETETLAHYAGYGGDPTDLTHFPPEKAFRVTEMVIRLLAASESPLACVIAPDR